MIIDVVYDVHEHPQLDKDLKCVIMVKKKKFMSHHLQVDEIIKSNMITFNIAIASQRRNVRLNTYIRLNARHICAVLLKFMSV